MTPDPKVFDDAVERALFVMEAHFERPLEAWEIIAVRAAIRAYLAAAAPADVAKFEHGGDWDAAAHVRLLRANGGASSGYTVDLIQNLHCALLSLSSRCGEVEHLLERAHAVMRACGWQLAISAEEQSEDGILEAACTEIEADVADALSRHTTGGE